MEQIKHILRRSISCLSFCAFIFYSQVSGGWTDTYSNDYSCMLTAWSLHNPVSALASNVIYDDGSSNYSGGYMSVSTGGAWNCGRQYLITEYTGVPVNFTFSYGDLGSASTIISHNIVITNLTTGVVVVNTFRSSGGTGLVLDASGYSFTSTARGEYEIQFFRPGVEANPDSADITGRIVLQTKIPVFYL